ncbi:hypothetical protein L2E82_02623 [Cichorium intybus]|uniref:Uncharacterized protein n=1 Tax=Cichorium intybus TaxID=13427 RepID=A0ACB9H1S8_CICIN|nr:hypothetical protein L2E82_02623 [Cichorium intybus]
MNHITKAHFYILPFLIFSSCFINIVSIVASKDKCKHKSASTTDEVPILGGPIVDDVNGPWFCVAGWV